MSAFEELVASYDQLEADAAALLDNAEAEANPELALTRRLREAAKRHKADLERVRAEVRAEIEGERKVEAQWRQAGVPTVARALFQGVDPGDADAVAARMGELKAMGVHWPGEAPPPPAPKGPDPMQAALAAMQAASVGGMPAGGLDLKTRMEKMAADPGAYTDRQRAEVVAEFNQAVNRAGMPSSAGVLG